MPKFRTGTDDFQELIDDGGYFVDKSLLIHEVMEGSKVTLLPRPRRFGKTLNMTMLRYFFEKGEADRRYLFDGLAIEDEPDCMARQGQHPVIYLSLKDVKGSTWEVARDKLNERLASLYKEHGYLLEHLAEDDRASFESVMFRRGSQADTEMSLKTLVSHLYDYHGKPVVVLIDEYDSPVIEAWRRDYYDQMIDFMRAWLGGGLKHEQGQALYRAVVTGILRVARESIFSGLNNLDVAGILKVCSYADKFGFTQAEVDQVLVDFDLAELAEPMQKWYNGYDFGGQVIYNPWSVIRCISGRPNPIGPEWLNTSSNDLVHAELEAGGPELKRDLEHLLAGEELRYPIVEDTVFKDIGKRPENIWSFLLFSGYLKAQDPQPSPFRQTEMLYRLAIPNLEVEIAYEQFVDRWHASLDFRATDELLRSLVTDDIVHFERLLVELVRNLMSCHDPAKQPEAVYHALVLGLLANLRSAYQIRSNPESGYGRADILMQPLMRDYPLGFVIEFKAVAPDGDAEAALAEAAAQIAAKAYDSQLLEAGVAPEHLRKLAIVFDGKKVVVKDLTERG